MHALEHMCHVWRLDWTTAFVRTCTCTSRVLQCLQNIITGPQSDLNSACFEGQTCSTALLQNSSNGTGCSRRLRYGKLLAADYCKSCRPAVWPRQAAWVDLAPPHVQARCCHKEMQVHSSPLPWPHCWTATPAVLLRRSRGLSFLSLLLQPVPLLLF